MAVRAVTSKRRACRPRVWTPYDARSPRIPKHDEAPSVSFPGPNFSEVTTIMMNTLEHAVYHDANPASTLQAAQAQPTAFMPK
jgi:hypothetical protein